MQRDLQVLGVRRWRELVIDTGKMERYCSTGQGPQRVVAPTDEEDEVVPKVSYASSSYTGSEDRIRFSNGYFEFHMF